MLAELIRNRGRIDGIEWIRLLYCYPEEIDDAKLLKEIALNEYVLKYKIYPFSTAARNTEKDRREGESISYSRLIDTIKWMIPANTRTTMITGFPVRLKRI